MILIIIIILTTILYLLYIQFSPQMGNIWWREDHFTPMGAIYVMLYPLKEIKIWNIEMWDINYFIWIIIGLFFYAFTFFTLFIFSFLGRVSTMDYFIV
jgi:ABC-type antimicrobial peptide transport system permease subunit